MSFLNRVGFETATTGTGTLDVGAALAGYATPAEAGAQNETAYTYVIEDGGDFEVGVGTYSTSGPTLSRDTVYLSKIGGTPGTTKLTLSGTAVVRLTVAAEDLLSPEATLKGRLAGVGTGAPANLSVSQVLGLLGAFSGINLQVFTSSGTYTPTAGMKFCIVIGTGGGGGGGASGGSGMGPASGGGAGATGIGLYSAAAIGANRSVTIGTAGTAGSAAGGNGGNGGATTFDSLFTAAGGVGGKGIAVAGNANVTAGGSGAASSGAAINIAGGPGGGGLSHGGGANINSCFSGDGGASFWGGGGSTVSRVASGATAGVAGAAWGSGGSGSASYSNSGGAAGGAGAAGILVVIELA